MATVDAKKCSAEFHDPIVSAYRAHVDSRVQFVIVGGAAATAHGAARLTQHLDVVYSRRPENLANLVAALAPHEPYLRGAPPDLLFTLDVETLQNGLNFPLTSKLGDIDLLGEIVGGGGYEQLVSDSIEIELFGVRCLCLGLEKLIQVKRAGGRPKDFEVLAELESISDSDE